VTPRVVQIDVQGQSYSIRSELDQAYVARLAAYVDERMAQAAKEIPSADSLRISVITALNLADELFRARSAGAGIESQVLARTADIERLVDAVLSGAATNAIAASQ
jgi:cell division protein ZapA